ncbi:uncharacterized protein EI97DRAFT_440936 [Westerdykella ornata]|uniref:Uncharacterized protein n=1 Tax=Westerdykella ornata TaxID=318751 RepID=A0A6A6JQ21_WESOR|nr:uncharacterized protein EI97DRAFT_440936 [Westerdykella ornata]KAF2278477.1 hypothetical protein EI97DRAFT_440936 [Westerdykella ornata]
MSLGLERLVRTTSHGEGIKGRAVLERKDWICGPWGAAESWAMPMHALITMSSMQAARWGTPGQHNPFLDAYQEQYGVRSLTGCPLVPSPLSGTPSSHDEAYSLVGRCQRSGTCCTTGDDCDGESSRLRALICSALKCPQRQVSAHVGCSEMNMHRKNIVGDKEDMAGS